MDKKDTKRIPMSISDIRLKNARTLVDQAGGLTRFADRINKTQPYVSRVVGKNPVTGIGDKVARQIEAAFSKHDKWLDTDFDAIKYAVNASPEMSSIPIVNLTESIDITNIIRNYDELAASQQTYRIPTTMIKETSGNNIMASITDDAMRNEDGSGFNIGDTIVVDLNGTPRPGKPTMFLTKDDMLIIRNYRVLATPGSGQVLEIIPNNPYYETLEEKITDNKGKKRGAVKSYAIVGPVVLHTTNPQK